MDHLASSIKKNDHYHFTVNKKEYRAMNTKNTTATITPHKRALSQAEHLQALRNQQPEATARRRPPKRSWAGLKSVLLVGSIVATGIGTSIFANKDAMLAQGAQTSVAAVSTESNFLQTAPTFQRRSTNGLFQRNAPLTQSWSQSNGSATQSFRPLTRSRSSR